MHFDLRGISTRRKLVMPIRSTLRFSIFFFTFLIMPVTTASASMGSVNGRIVRIYADPSDIVVVLDKGGPCGSTLFHFQRNNENFKEITSLMYLAAASKYNVDIVVANCTNDRNIASHGSADF